MNDASTPESGPNQELIDGIAEIERQAGINWAGDDEAIAILAGGKGERSTPKDVQDARDLNVKWNYRVVRVLQNGELVLGFQRLSELRPGVFVDYKATINKTASTIRIEEFTGTPDLSGDYGNEPIWTLEINKAALGSILGHLSSQKRNIDATGLGESQS